MSLDRLASLSNLMSQSLQQHLEGPLSSKTGKNSQVRHPQVINNNLHEMSEIIIVEVDTVKIVPPVIKVAKSTLFPQKTLQKISSLPKMQISKKTIHFLSSNERTAKR